jgi:precorrin-6B methylase 2
MPRRFDFEIVRRFWYNRQDKHFEWKYGITTDHLKILDQIPNLDTQKSIQGGHSKGYQACYVRNIREAIRESLRILPSATVFIDLGSGLGKTLIVAREIPQLKKIVGIEYLTALHIIAEKNIESHKGDRIHLLNADAKNFLIDLQPTIVFLFNPFDDVIMENFLKNNIRTIKASKSVIAYVNDIHRNELEKIGMRQFYRNELRKISVWQ